MSEHKRQEFLSRYGFPGTPAGTRMEEALNDLMSEHKAESAYLDQIKYVRLQVPGCTIVEFRNGSRACSCGLVRGTLPNLRTRPGEEES